MSAPRMARWVPDGLLHLWPGDGPRAACGIEAEADERDNGPGAACPKCITAVGPALADRQEAASRARLAHHRAAQSEETT